MFNKLKGRYAEKKAKKERAVISYEDMPLDDYEPERTDLSLWCRNFTTCSSISAQLVTGCSIF